MGNVIRAIILWVYSVKSVRMDKFYHMRLHQAKIFCFKLPLNISEKIRRCISERDTMAAAFKVVV